MKTGNDAKRIEPRTLKGFRDYLPETMIPREWLIDTADLVGFRLDRGTTVPGVRPASQSAVDWATSFPFVPTEAGVLGPDAVQEPEHICQEAIWESVPRLLHPLYRLVGPWHRDGVSSTTDELSSDSGIRRSAASQPSVTHGTTH